MVLREDGVCCPEAFITFVDFVNAPKKLALQDQDLNITWVLLQAIVYLLERPLLVACSNQRQSLQVGKLHIIRVDT